MITDVVDSLIRESNAAPPADVWCVLDLLGHLRLAGRLTEEERFGARMGRLDVPQEDGTFTTQFFGGQSVYRLSVVTEAVARRVAAETHSAPVQPWDYPKQLPPARAESPPPLFGTTDDPDDECDDDRPDRPIDMEF